MARRTVNCGVDLEFIRQLGIPLEKCDGAPVKPLSGYVAGRFSDEGPLAPLLWADLRRAYSVQRIDHRDAMMFEMHLVGVSYRRIAQAFGMAPNTVREHVTVTERRVLSCPGLGILTVIVEQCGGWRAAAELMF